MTESEHIEHLRDHAYRSGALLAVLEEVLDELRGERLSDRLRIRVECADRLRAEIAAARVKNYAPTPTPPPEHFVADFGCGPGVDPELGMNRPPVAPVHGGADV